MNRIRKRLTAGTETSSEAFIYIIGLRFDFLPVFEGEADVVGSVDGDVVRQPVPAFQHKLGQFIRHGCKGFQEAELLSGGIIHADETVVQVLHEPGRNAKTQSRMWV